MINNYLNKRIRMQLSTICIAIICLFHISTGLYIASVREDHSHDKEWSELKQTISLSNQKVELLKSQKEQKGTVNLIKQFLEQNPEYKLNKKVDNIFESKDFLRVFHNILRRLNLSKSTLNTSVNVEFASKSKKNSSRHRRKIAVKMVSDFPSEQIDDLLKIFNLKHGINDEYKDTDEANDDGSNYNDFLKNLPSASDPDYMYENLYDDEEDLAVPAKSHHNSEYGSLQDLILKAGRNQVQREIEATKLHNYSSNHFI